MKTLQAFMNRLLIIFVLLCAPGVEAGGVIYMVDVQDWLEIRQGDKLMSHPSLHALISDWMRSSPGSHIEIYHAGQESLAKWALELRNRLVTFGIPSRHLRLRIQDMDSTHFQLRVVRSERSGND